MKLDRAFYRLSVQFDVQQLRAEVDALPASAWVNHPNDIKGNRSVRLISVDGGENDDIDGIMLPTPHLLGSPYLCQVLASFGVVWSRSRLLKLEPFACVPKHADINYHWFNRVRLHIPIATHPAVKFFCGDETVHMAEGEAWIFDNWRLHGVDNPIDADRIHLVADTSGSASFWQFVGHSAISPTRTQHHIYDPKRETQLLTERSRLRSVMAPSEVDLLLLDLKAELVAEPRASGQAQLMRYAGLLSAFRHDWRQLYQLFGESEVGRAEYVKLRDSLRSTSREAGTALTMRTNRISAHNVLEGRVLGVVLPSSHSNSMQAHPQVNARIHRPIFIVSAPRSGSTLLYETLAASDQIWTVGGEAHWLIESIPELRPGCPGVDSNRLSASHHSDQLSELITRQILANLKDNRGRPLPPTSSWRFLEKTPKNALRVPFFDRIFPDALFIHLWRDPRENLSSIMEAWRSGHWQTYNCLEGLDGPWSLLLPPGWTELRGKNLEEIAAFQWETTNRILLEDLSALPKERWAAVSYSELISDPAAVIQKLCDFTGIYFCGTLAERVAGRLPLSRFTQTPPVTGKWLQNEAAVLRVMPRVRETWQRLQDLTWG